MRPVYTIIFLLFCGLNFHASAQSHIFAELKGTPVNTDGWNLIGWARPGNSPGQTSNSEIVMVPTATYQSGALFFKQPINLGVCKKWYAEFDMRMFDGNGADGLVFCFLDVPPTGFIPGIGLGIPLTANGLKVAFDIFKNCGAPTPKIEIRWGAGYDGECSTQPTLDNSTGALSFLRSNNYNHVKVEYDQGNIKVSVNGTLYLTGFQEFNFSGYLGFTAATGALYDLHTIKNVTIFTEAPPSDAGPNVSVCPGGSVQLGVTPDPAYNYIWTAAPELSSTSIANPTASGFDNNDTGVIRKVYYLRTEFAASLGCPSYDSVVVSVNLKPKPNFLSAPVCAPQYMGQFTDKSTIADKSENAFTYLWNFGDGGNSTVASPTHNYATSGSYNVNLKVTSGKGCTYDTTRTININQRTTAAFLSPIESCLQDTVRLTDACVGNGNTVTKWRYDFGDGTKDTLQNPKHKYAAPGTYTIKQFVLTNEGCSSDTATKIITILPSPVADFSPGVALCRNQPVNFTDNSTSLSAVTKWNWDFGDGSVSTIQNPTHPYSNITSYTVKLSVENSSGCVSGVVTKTVTVGPAPVVKFSVPVGCDGTPRQFTDNSTISSGTTAGFTYLWNFGDGGTATVANPTHLFTTTGTYNVKLEVTSASGCKSDTTQAITITPKASAGFTLPATTCLTNSVQFTDAAVANGNTIAKWRYDFGDGKIDSVQNPAHTYASAGTYTIKQWVITSLGCASDTMTKTISIAPAPVAAFNTSLTLCKGQSIQFTDQSSSAAPLTKWTWIFGDGNISSVQNPTNTYTASNSYTVKLVVENGGGCKSDTLTKTVVVESSPVVKFAVPPGCDGVPRQFTDNSTIASGNPAQFTYLWNFGDGSTATIANPSHQFPTTGNYNVKLEVTSGSGCKSDTTQSITINPKASAGFTLPATTCLTSAIQFTDASSGNGNTIAKWNYDFGDGKIDSVQNPSHLYAVAGTYTVKQFVTSALGCGSDTMSKAITITPAPIADFQTGASLCKNQAITFTDKSTSATTLTKWNWNFGDGNVSTAQNPSNAFANANNFVVKLVVENGSGCKSDTASKTVTINPSPLVNFAITPGCEGMPRQFADATTIASGSPSAFVYLWNFGDGSTSTQNNPSHLYATTGTFNVKLEVTSGAGCKSDSTQAISINPKSKAGFTAVAKACLKDAVAFTDAAVGNGNIIAKWNYDFGDGTMDSVQNPSHVYAAAGTYTIKQFVISNFGCTSDTVSKTIIIDPAPLASFNSSIALCQNQVISFTDQSTSAVPLTKWSWSFGEGSVSTLQNPTNTYGVANTYDVKLIVENSNGCKSDVVTKSITINPPPAVAFATPQICEGVAGQFTDNTPAGTNTYAWDFGDTNNSTVQNPTHAYTIGGNYTVKLSVTSAAGCTGLLTKTISVNSTPQADFGKAATAAYCGNGAVILTDKSSVTFGSIDKTVIFWNWPNLTDTTVDNSPAAGKSYSHQYTGFNNPPTNQYNIKWVSATNSGCGTSKLDSVILKASPKLQFDVIPTFCANSNTFIVSAKETAGLSGTGYFSGTGITAAGLFDPAIARAGNHTISYTYTMTNGCTDSISQVVSVGALPVISAGADKFVSAGQSVVIDATAGSTGLRYKWTPAIGLNNDTILRPTASPTQETLYTLEATSVLGCKSTDQVLVRFRKPLVIPSGFSPNGDGINDKWNITYIQDYPDAVVEVFDRYGQRVYGSSAGYSSAWDGTYKGKPVPVGVYYYLVNTKTDGAKPITGSITILR